MLSPVQCNSGGAPASLRSLSRHSYEYVLVGFNASSNSSAKNLPSRRTACRCVSSVAAFGRRVGDGQTVPSPPTGPGVEDSRRECGPESVHTGKRIASVHSQRPIAERIGWSHDSGGHVADQFSVEDLASFSLTPPAGGSASCGRRHGTAQAFHRTFLGRTRSSQTARRCRHVFLRSADEVAEEWRQGPSHDDGLVAETGYVRSEIADREG